MLPRKYATFAAVITILFSILACGRQPTQLEPESFPSATSIDQPTATVIPTLTNTQAPQLTPTHTQTPLLTATHTPTFKPSPTFTYTPSRTSTPTNTSLPPLPDFENMLTYGGGAGGGLMAYEYCQSNFPGQIPAAIGKKTIRRTAYLCLWGIPYDIPFQVILTSPNNNMVLTGIFNIASETNTVAWSGHIQEEHDSKVYAANGTNLVVITPWWSDELPGGKWSIRVNWSGSETYGNLDANETEIVWSPPYITTTDLRISTEILPSGVIEQRTIHPATAERILGSGFEPNSIVYLLLYTAEDKGVFNPTWESFVYVTGETILVDSYGYFIKDLTVNLERGKLYWLLGVSNPNANLTFDGEFVNPDAIDADELFYTQPLASTFDVSVPSSGCPGAPPQRMVVNQQGYICTQGDSVLLRDAPAKSASTIVSLTVGSQFTVIGGPSCADDWSWWQIQTDDGYTGWISEGGDDVDPYFICPLP